MKEQKKLLKIGEISRLYNLPTSTIRFYSDHGLLDVDGRTVGGFRVYDPEKVGLRLKRIQELIEKGYTLPEIKKILDQYGIKRKVLVVDDEPSVGEFFIDLFKESDVEVKVAYDGFTAGVLLNDFRPDLIILDLLLPGIDGFEICRLVKSNVKTRDIKILAITAYDTADHRAKIENAGVDDYFAKPLDVSVLSEKINKLLPNIIKK